MPSRAETALAIFLARGASGRGGRGAARLRPTTAFVVCAPGYPGSTAEAESVMDAFAEAVAAAAGQPRGALSAEYHETEAGGLERLARPDAGFVFAPLPFFLAHEADLHLVARAQAVMQGGEASEVYSLVAGEGKRERPRRARRLGDPGHGGLRAALRAGPGARRLGRAARHDEDSCSRGRSSPACAGRPPARRSRCSSTARRRPGSRASPTPGNSRCWRALLPLPAFIVATVGERVAPAHARQLVDALLALASRPDGAAALASLRLSRFVPLDDTGLKRARARLRRRRHDSVMRVLARAGLGLAAATLAAVVRAGAARAPARHADGRRRRGRGDRAPAPARTSIGCSPTGRPASRSGPTGPRCAPPSARTWRRRGPTTRGSRACSASPASRAG